MNVERLIRFFAITSIVTILLVILAGSIVRMTGSGMGCPDWPKCFGYIVPPTSANVLTFSPEKNFEKNQMVIRNDTLWVAKSSISSGGKFDRAQWEKYPKHDYSIFNPIHTWIEYINRLLGALSGIPILLLVVCCAIRFSRTKDFYTLALALATLFFLGFEAWLGKKVVDGNLKEEAITLHMFGSLAILALLTTLIYRFGKKSLFPAFNPAWKWFAAALLLASTIQIFTGTQVREQIDALDKSGVDRENWIALLPNIFIVHRLCAYLVLLLSTTLFIKNRRIPSPLISIQVVGWLVMLEFCVGIVMANWALPKFAQPLHIITAAGIFACAFYINLVVWRRQMLL
jgi:cytochrome c oxidase assembly protein subunit 15